MDPPRVRSAGVRQGPGCGDMLCTPALHSSTPVPAQALDVLLQGNDAQAWSGEGGDTTTDSTAGSVQSDDVNARAKSDPVATTSLTVMSNAPAPRADPPGPSTKAMQRIPHSKKRACLSCRQLKKLCDGNYPCSGCVARGRQCVYHSQLCFASGFLTTGQGLAGPSTLSHHQALGSNAGEQLQWLYQMNALAHWQAIRATFPLCSTIPYSIQPGPKAEDGVESMRGQQSFAVAKKIECMDGERPTKKVRDSVSEACMTCRKSKVKCDEQKPCTRCIQAGHASTCFPWRQWQSMDPQSNTSLAAAVCGTKRASESPKRSADSSTQAAPSDGVSHGSFHDAICSGTKRGRDKERNSSRSDYGHCASVLTRDAEKTGEEAMAFSKTEPGEEEDWKFYTDSTSSPSYNDDDFLDWLMI